MAGWPCSSEPVRPASRAKRNVLGGTRKFDAARAGFVVSFPDSGGLRLGTTKKGFSVCPTPSKVTEKASFIDDLGADSLDNVELVMAFEEEFDIEIPDDAAEHIQTVGDAVKFIDEKLGA